LGQEAARRATKWLIAAGNANSTNQSCFLAVASLSRYEAAECRNQIMGLLLRRSAAP
jgi:hypothetical protein